MRTRSQTAAAAARRGDESSLLHPKYQLIEWLAWLCAQIGAIVLAWDASVGIKCWILQCSSLRVTSYYLAVDFQELLGLLPTQPPGPDWRPLVVFLLIWLPLAVLIDRTRRNAIARNKDHAD